MGQERGPLARGFYMRDANAVALELLGKTLVRRSAEGVTAGVIVEVESYIGSSDRGAHSYLNRRTKRTEIQFGPGGYAYVYLIYGMHACFNIVTNGENQPEAVLVRALEPLEGLELMARRRNTQVKAALCSGPGKLCQAMDITRELYGCDLCGGELYVEEGRQVEPGDIMVSPRINIDFAGECKDYLWRYFLRDNPYVSKVPKRYCSRPFVPEPQQ